MKSFLSPSERQRRAMLADRGLRAIRDRQAHHDALCGPVIDAYRRQGMSWGQIAGLMDLSPEPPATARGSSPAAGAAATATPAAALPCSAGPKTWDRGPGPPQPRGSGHPARMARPTPPAGSSTTARRYASRCGAAQAGGCLRPGGTRRFAAGCGLAPAARGRAGGSGQVHRSWNTEIFQISTVCPTT